MANRAFLDWVTRIHLEELDNGPYPGWVMDGDFFGAGGLWLSVIPVHCLSDKHDHLPGDSNYLTQKALRI